MGTGRVLDVAVTHAAATRDRREVALEVGPPELLGRAAVAGAVDGAGEERHDRHARLGHRDRHLVVGPPLRAVVDGEVGPLVPVGLVDHRAAGVRVDGQRARIDGLRHAELVDELEDVPGALDVDPLGDLGVGSAHLVPARDVEDAIDLSTLVPLIARPTSPGNVVPVSEVAGEPIYQAYIGSSANPGYRDFAVPARMVRDKAIYPGVSFDVNPTSRSTLETLARDGHLLDLIHAGARLHQAGCNGCIGMGQAPASGRNSLRTTPRNFPGRSGTDEDSVFLCSPETATASALKGEITDPRRLGMKYPRIRKASDPVVNEAMVEAPPRPGKARNIEIVKGPNIVTLPEFDELPNQLTVPILLKVGDDVSTDEIMRAGSEVLPFRSNIPAMSRHVFEGIDKDFGRRAEKTGKHAVVGGSNYGQGSSREHAAVAPRYLGLRVVVARSFARIHWQNLVNFGILPLTFVRKKDYDSLEQGMKLKFTGLHKALESGEKIRAEVDGKDSIELEHRLSPRQIAILRAGGIINWQRKRT